MIDDLRRRQPCPSSDHCMHLNDDKASPPCGILQSQVRLESIKMWRDADASPERAGVELPDAGLEARRR
jgi:hypothetical protein